MYIGHVYTHEHDFDLAKFIEGNKQLLTCSMCGKEVSIPYSCLDAEGNGAQMSMRSG
jgi:predicted nucleic acid binding AN1-type Zn finger protein